MTIKIRTTIRLLKIFFNVFVSPKMAKKNQGAKKLFFEAFQNINEILTAFSKKNLKWNSLAFIIFFNVFMFVQFF